MVLRPNGQDEVETKGLFSLSSDTTLLGERETVETTASTTVPSSDAEGLKLDDEVETEGETWKVTGVFPNQIGTVVRLRKDAG